MRRSIMMSLPVLAVTCLLAGGATHSDGGWWGDLYQETTTPLEKIIESPEAFRGLTVSFVAQFHKVGKIDNPYYTKFESEWYLNFSVWPDASQLWEKGDYRKDFPFMFIRRMADGARELLTAPKYSRWIFTAQVSDVFRGQPWIEVIGMKRLDTQLNETALIHTVKAVRLRDLNRHEAAAQEFHLAAHNTLPPLVRTMLMREEAVCLHTSGQTQLALARLEEADVVMPEDPRTQSLLTLCRAALGIDGDGNPIEPSPAPVGSERDVEAIPVHQPANEGTPAPMPGSDHGGVIEPVSQPVDPSQPQAFDGNDPAIQVPSTETTGNGIASNTGSTDHTGTTNNNIAINGSTADATNGKPMIIEATQPIPSEGQATNDFTNSATEGNQAPSIETKPTPTNETTTEFEVITFDAPTGEPQPANPTDAKPQVIRVNQIEPAQPQSTPQKIKPTPNPTPKPEFTPKTGISGNTTGTTSPQTGATPGNTPKQNATINSESPTKKPESDLGPQVIPGHEVEIFDVPAKPANGNANANKPASGNTGN